MMLREPRRYPRVAAAVATLLGVPLAKADPPPAPDTSGWKCEQCPFFQGYTANAEAGVLYANGANASSGRYTGIDHVGAYADAAADGQWRRSNGSYGDYSLERLGLPSREGYIEAGKEGRYDVRVSYDGQPTRLYDTTVTPFLSPERGQLTLPAGWVAAGSTSSMTRLAPSLMPVELGFDRRTVLLTSKYFLEPSWTLFANLEHQEKEGTGIIGGAFLTQAVELPQPIDYRTDSFEVGASWESRAASARLSYTASWFQDNTAALTFANPYLPLVADASKGRLALPPSNNLRQVAASGEVRLPLFTATTLTYHVSYGWLGQDGSFLPVSTLPSSPSLPQSSLGGQVRLAHYALGISSSAWTRLYVRSSASYDGRDDHTAVLTVPQILTDALPDGVAVTPRYGEDRTRLEGSADYRLLGWLRLGVGGQFQSIHYSPGQVLNWMQDERSYGQMMLNPLAALSFTIKAGNASRETSSYNAAALPPGENPLLRAYNYAPRDSNFISFNGSWSPLAALTWAMDGTWSDDAYRLTQLGLQEARERKIAATLTWAPTQKTSLYLDGGYQRLSALQRGDIGNGAPPWNVRDDQSFWNAGAGGRFTIRTRWELGVDCVHTLTRGSDTTFVSSLPELFPENRYTLDSVSVNGSYQVSQALKLRLRYLHERYSTSDWSIEDVGPATVPTLLALGQQPYRYTVNVVSLSFQYRLDTARRATTEK
jgi:MtrB/PioB family decaheme-associated outer membrane protein